MAARARDPRGGRQGPAGVPPLIGEAVAFAPGHVTGIFAPSTESDDPTKTGSRGAGFSVRLGVTSHVRVAEEGFPGIDGHVNGRAEPMGTTREAVRLLLGDAQYHVRIEQTMDLPVSQGFGMSAAGALSAALAVAAIFDRPRREAVWAAHCAEVVERTGLGDVVGSALGGFETRKTPGLEPYGTIERFRTGARVEDVLLAVVDESILTNRVLADPDARRRATEAGAKALESFWAQPSLATFAESSQRFSIEARLATQQVSKVYADLQGLGLVSQCMLGGSVFAFGASPQLRTRLSRWGTVYPTKIDFEGARVLELSQKTAAESPR